MAALIPDLPTEIGSRLKLQRVVQRHGTNIRGYELTCPSFGSVGFAVVGEVADAVYGVFKEGCDGKDGEADGSAGKRTGEGQDKAGGFTHEGEDANGLGGHTQRLRSQPVRREGAVD